MTPKQNPKSSPSARLCCLHALMHSLDKGKPLDTAWTQDKQFGKLVPKDRAFAQLIAKTTLRRLGQIDNIIRQLLERPLPGSATRAQHILRMGICQLLWLETPPHAAVSTAVDLAKENGQEKFSGLINAVLKRADREGRTLAQTHNPGKINTPDWLWHSWIKDYGKETCNKIVQAHLGEPPLDITTKDDPHHWVDKLNAHLLPTGTLRLTEKGRVTELKGFEEGQWWVQDAAASIPAQLLGKVQGETILDLCAAPGGKTAQLIAKGAKVTAVDVSESRMHILEENLKRLNMEAQLITADVLKWTPKESPDGILLDAPCSATGTLRRHPDVAWNKRPSDIKRLCDKQYRLLNHALDMLKPGGKLVYAVCSLQKEEGEEQIMRILKNRSDAALMPVPPYYSDYITRCGGLRTLPSHMAENGGMDGFYAALLTKTE